MNDEELNRYLARYAEEDLRAVHEELTYEKLDEFIEGPTREIVLACHAVNIEVTRAIVEKTGLSPETVNMALLADNYLALSACRRARIYHASQQ